MSAILLALGSALSFGSADFLAGLSSRRLGTLVVLLVSQAIAVFLFGLVVLITGTSVSWSVDFFILAAAAGGAEAIGLAAFYRGMAVGAMGVVAPISACAAVVPVAFGLATGEKLSGAEFAGVSLALAGVVVLGCEPGEQGKRAKVAAGAGFAIVAALAIGGYFVALASAVDQANPLAAVLISRVTLVLGVVCAVLALREGVGRARSALGVLALIGIFDIGGSTLYAAASSHGDVAIVGVLAALYPVTTVVLAHVVVGERLAIAQRLGAVAGIAGVALIASMQ